MKIREKKQWLALIVLCSLFTGCAFQERAVLPQAPELIQFSFCPSPKAPLLTLLDDTYPFDAPTNIKALLERDDFCRRYMQALEATIRCYEMQFAKDN